MEIQTLYEKPKQIKAVKVTAESADEIVTKATDRGWLITRDGNKLVIDGTLGPQEAFAGDWVCFVIGPPDQYWASTVAVLKDDYEQRNDDPEYEGG